MAALGQHWRPVAAALATGVFIALYTVTDGLGVRADEPVALNLDDGIPHGMQQGCRNDHDEDG